MKYNNIEQIKEIDTYFKDLKKCTPLKREEEIELARKIQMGDKSSLDKLVTSNLKFVVKVVKNYRSSGVPFTDLISEGNLGLIRAAEKYDGRSDVKFTSYAIWWIRAAIQDCIDKYKPKSNNVEVDEYVLINAVNDELGTCKDNSLITNETEDDLTTINSRRDSIDDLLKVLQEREIDIIKMYFGFGEKEMTLDEIGEAMHLTNERVRKIKEKALVKLRSAALINDEFHTMKALY